MHDVASRSHTRRRPHWVNVVVIVVVLGVLPLAEGAPVFWRILGPLLAGVLVVRSLHLVWRTAFSTRHLGAAGRPRTCSSPGPLGRSGAARRGAG